MNIVFWFLVILVLVLVWFGCICIFPSLGRSLLNLFKQGKDVFSGKDDDDEYNKFDNEEDYK
ncbi:MAG: hypothetical protein NC489_37095 [Ruminococcus flavefaciens]|nr:hypothetical protein [Ruminococcus flavefaciens]